MYQDIAIIGGGRWAKVLSDTLLEVVKPNTNIYFCSPSNPTLWQSWISEKTQKSSNLLKIKELQDILNNKNISHVVIARKAGVHASTALEFLNHSKHVLVEKPFALNIQNAEAVLFASKNASCMIGHVLFFATHLRLFFSEIKKKAEIIDISISWCDAGNEVRHGMEKRYDASVPLWFDAGPHIWTILKLASNNTPEIREAKNERNGLSIRANGHSGAIKFSFLAERESSERSRKITVRTTSGLAEIDFSSEPGRAILLVTILISAQIIYGH